MEILKYLMENFYVDGENDIQDLISHIKANFTADDACELANVLVLIDNMPKELSQPIWDMI